MSYNGPPGWTPPPPPAYGANMPNMPPQVRGARTRLRAEKCPRSRAPLRFFNTFFERGRDRGAAGPRARALPAPRETRARFHVPAPPRARHRRRGRSRVAPFPDHVISRVFSLFTHAAGVSPVDGILRSGQHGAVARVLGGDDVWDGRPPRGRGLRGLRGDVPRAPAPHVRAAAAAAGRDETPPRRIAASALAASASPPPRPRPAERDARGPAVPGRPLARGRAHRGGAASVPGCAGERGCVRARQPRVRDGRGGGGLGGGRRRGLVHDD